MAHVHYNLHDIMDLERLVATARELKARDEYEGKVRISGNEMNAVQRLVAGVSMVVSAVSQMPRVIKRAKAYRLYAYVGGLIKMTKVITDNLPAHQMRSLATNLDNAEVVITSNPAPYKLALEYPSIYALAEAAIKNCSIDCMCTEKESRKCLLRKALEEIPGVQDSTMDEYDANHCPFLFANLHHEPTKD